MGVSRPTRFVRFDSFQLDLHAGELRRNGVKLRVPDQSIQVLAMLLDRPGEIVTRQELHHKLWPNGTIVEFDHSINAAVNRLRQALEDSADEPRFIETLPRRGYRFLVPVEPAESVESVHPSELEPDSDELVAKTISHFRVLRKLGQGAMGVVYEAKDTKLGRSVALKFLPEELSDDPRALQRLELEARAASALNHPNICTVYEVDECDGVRFIAMEYVAGKTLDQVIDRKGLRLNDSLKYSVQIADALSRAHSAGIVHRDLKPGNIMVTELGSIKVLDFGLAKLTEAGVAGEYKVTGTMEPTSEEGKIVGTGAYMSPEQAEGKPVDARSDIFSLGSVLYEMLTAQRAFHGETQASTIAAILLVEPKPPSQIVEGLPREVDRFLRRCLQKSPADRFQTMAELSVALVELKGESDSGAPESAARAVPKGLFPLRWAVAAAALLVTAGVVFVRSRIGPPEARLVAVPLTTYAGEEDFPSFSPDGTQVAFEWCRGPRGKNCRIYVKQMGVEPPFRLTGNTTIEDFSPAWSPDGQNIAFARQVTPNKVAVVITPQRGGYERVLDEFDNSGQRQGIAGPYLAWTPDSKWIVSPGLTEYQNFALFLISVDTGEKRKLTSPPVGKTTGDTAPAFSPDGRTLAFSRENLSVDRVDLYLLHLASDYRPQGEPEKVESENSYNHGSAWTPDGRYVVFGSGTGTSMGLWRIAARNLTRPRTLGLPADFCMHPSISRQGNRLAYAVMRVDENIWRVTLSEPGRKPTSPVKLISSTKRENSPSYSPDGKKIAFVSDRSGAQEVWVCDADGSNTLQLTSFGGGMVYGPRWSPDGNIGFTAAIGGKSETYIVSRNGGKPRPLITQPAQDQWPYWSQDGKRLYFASIRSGRYEIWKMPSKGGEAVQITHGGGDQPEESPDGTVIYYSKGWPNEMSVWKVPVEGGEEVRVLDSVHTAGQWTVARHGIYFFSAPDSEGHSDIRLYEFSTGKIKKILRIDSPIGWGIAVSPGGQAILYPQIDEMSSDLMLVDKFR